LLLHLVAMEDPPDGTAAAMALRSPVMMAIPPRLQQSHRRTKAARGNGLRGAMGAGVMHGGHESPASPNGPGSTALPAVHSTSDLQRLQRLGLCAQCTPPSMQRARSTGALSSPLSSTAPPAVKSKGAARIVIDDASSEDSDEKASNLRENIRLRKRLHKTANELQNTQKELEITKRDFSQARSEMDDMKLKLLNLERVDRTKSAELLEERRKSDDLSKQVKNMSQNLLSIMQLQEGGDVDMSGMQKRCFKLVQQNTRITVQESLLRRQKDWAEAKARVLEREVKKVFLGTHKQVKDSSELEAATNREFTSGGSRAEEAKIYKFLVPTEYKYKETVTDFLTHINHTHGQDVHGFLEGSRVYSNGIRTDCISGLGREFFATWKLNRQLPQILRSVEKLIHLGDYLDVFEHFTAEITDLLACGHARLWVADHVQHSLWTCTRDGDSKKKTTTIPLPKGRMDLAGQGLAVAACMTQKAINIGDAHQDPRYRAGADGDDPADGSQAMNVLCVPIVKQGKVRVILEAVNKTQGPNFDPEADTRVLRLLGKVSMEVLQVCQDKSAGSKNSLRKESLLLLFTDQVPCQEPIQLIHALDHGLKEIFMSQACALHIPSSTADSITRYQISNNAAGQKKLQKHTSDGLTGVAGQVIKTKNQQSLIASQLDANSYNPLADIEISKDGRCVMHSVPICEGAACLAVVQFMCPEREEGAVGDDGAYHPENTSHFRILTTLLTFVQKHMHVLLSKRRASNESADALGEDHIAAMALAQSQAGRPAADDEEDDGCSQRARVRTPPAKRTEEEEEKLREKAALLIQRHARGKSSRERVNMLKAEKSARQKEVEIVRNTARMKKPKKATVNG